MSLKEVIRNGMVEEFLQKEKDKDNSGYIIDKCFIIPIEYKEKINCLKTIDFVAFLCDQWKTFEETKMFIKKKYWDLWKFNNIDWRIPREDELRAIVEAFKDTNDVSIKNSLFDGLWTNKAYRTEKGGFCSYAIGLYYEKFKEPNDKSKIVLIGGLK